jgi:anti-anti-sigma factor
MDFFSALALHAPNAHLVAKGEFDAFAAHTLYRRLDNAIDHGCISYTVDASAVTFVDAGGLGMLVRLSNTVAPFGGTVIVTAASPRFRQIAELVGLGDAFGLDLLSIHDPSRRLTLVAAHSDRMAGSHVARSVHQRPRRRSAR